MMRLNKHTRATGYTYIGQKHSTAGLRLPKLAFKSLQVSFLDFSFTVMFTAVFRLLFQDFNVILKACT